MSKGPLILCLLIELWCLYLTPATSETVVTGFLGQPVTLPCMYLSWSKSNSMCWGKGSCPNSKCNEELLHTDEKTVLSRKSAKYELRGNIQRGDVSLTIFNTHNGDETVYCCRIEVPGWFNDVKKNIRLKLIPAPTTTLRPTMRRPNTRRPTPTIALTTTTTVVTTPELTTVVTTPDLTTRTALQMRTTTALTTATTCPLTTLGSLPETATVLTTELSTEGPTLTAESETVFLSSNSPRSTEATSEKPALLTSTEPQDRVFQSTRKASTWEKRDLVTFPLVTQKMASYLLIAASLGFVLCAAIVAFLLRGKVMKTNCFQKHTRLDNVGDSKNVLDDMQQEREDEDGLFTL